MQRQYKRPQSDSEVVQNKKIRQEFSYHDAPYRATMPAVIRMQQPFVVQNPQTQFAGTPQTHIRYSIEQQVGDQFPSTSYWPENGQTQFRGPRFDKNRPSVGHVSTDPNYETLAPSTSRFSTGQSTNITAPVTRESQKSLRILTGGVEKVLTTWSRVARNEAILYKVIGVLDHMRQPLNPHQFKFFMTDSGSGPQLPVEYYAIDRSLPQLTPGEIVKATGLMRGRILQAFLVEKSSKEELMALQRVIHVCDRTIADIVRQ